MKTPMIRSLTFQDGHAETAMNFYVGLFDNSKVLSLTHWAEGGPVEAGKVMQATFELDGNLFMRQSTGARLGLLTGRLPLPGVRVGR